MFSLLLVTLILRLIGEDNAFLFQLSIHNCCPMNAIWFLTLYVSSTDFVFYIYLSNSQNLLLHKEALCVVSKVHPWILKLISECFSTKVSQWNCHFRLMSVKHIKKLWTTPPPKKKKLWLAEILNKLFQDNFLKNLWAKSILFSELSNMKLIFNHGG